MAEEKRALRAGGWVDRRDGHGWVLDTGPRPKPSAQRPATPKSQPDAEPRSGQAECPDCGKTVIVNKNGTLRKHTCVVDAAPPQVTFDGENGEEEENDDG